MEFQRAQMKAAARLAMKGQRPHPMLITLLFTILVNIGSQIVSGVLGAASGLTSLTTAYAQAFIESGDPASAIQYALLSIGPQRLMLALFAGSFVAGIITMLWTGLMRVGYYGFCLGMVRGQQPQTGTLFSAFPRFGPVLLTQFLAGLFRGLWIMLLLAGYFVLAFAGTMIALAVDLEILMILFLIADITVFCIGCVWVTLRYAMVDFLVADQGLTGMDAIRESKRMMRGNTGRLFALELSFIGWYLLEIGILLAAYIIGIILFGSALAFGGSEVLMVGSVLGFFGLVILGLIAMGIFTLWLTPYVTGTSALFYDWLRGADSPRPASGGQGGWGQPYPPQQNTSYTWTPNPGSSSGTGIGPGPQGGDTPSQLPKSPKDDPWE